MRNWIKTSLLVSLLLFAGLSFGQEMKYPAIDAGVVKTLKKTPNFGFGVSSERPLKGAFMMYHQMAQNNVRIKNYEIVIWGPVLKQIAEDKGLYSFIEQQMNPAIKVVVCAVAMEKLDLKLEDLPKGMELVDNAYLRILELQAKNYNFVIP